MRVLRVFHHYCSARQVALYLGEQAAMLALFVVAAGLALRLQTPPAWLWLVALAFVSGLAFQAALYFGDLYDLKVAAADRAAGLRLLKAMGAATLTIGLVALLFPGEERTGAIAAGVAGASLGLIATRAALPRLVGDPARVLVVGAGPRARALAGLLEGNPEYELVEAVPAASPLTALEPDLAAQKSGASLVALALEDGDPMPVEALLRCRRMGLEVLDAARLAERALRRLPVALLGPRELAVGSGMRRGALDDALKRALDLSASLLLSLLGAPLVGFAALLIKLDSPGPIFYSQERVGRDGRRFLITKLRTMRADAEREGKPVWAQVGDERVTRVGRLLRKTRMDELPQVWAVLRGDMSFVGPRPERPFFVDQIRQQVPLFGLREAVKPGITGWAQIRYPYGASIDDARAKLEYDLYYIKNRSVFLDLAIIFHTARHVLFGRGAR